MDHAREVAVVGWWVGNALGFVVVIPLVLLLATKTLKLIHEVYRYAEDIAEHGGNLAEHLAVVPALEQTRAHVADVKSHAAAYVTALEKLV